MSSARNESMKLSVHRLQPNSIQTVWLLKQVKIAPNLSEVPSIEHACLPCLMVRGPK